MTYQRPTVAQVRALEAEIARLRSLDAEGRILSAWRAAALSAKRALADAAKWRRQHAALLQDRVDRYSMGYEAGYRSAWVSLGLGEPPNPPMTRIHWAPGDQ